MVLIDGKPEYSCSREAQSVAGKAIVTVEGLWSGDELSALQKAFLDEQAGQCGYCVPGILILGYGPSGTEQEAQPRGHHRGARSASLPLRHPEPRGPGVQKAAEMIAAEKSAGGARP